MVEPDRQHREIPDFGVHCSWNYREMMLNLPCGWVRNWQGKQAVDLVEPVTRSLMLLRQNPGEYELYEIDHEKHLGSIDNCQYILSHCLEGFEEHPDGIVKID